MRYKNESALKANGVVYTPTELAEYLSCEMLNNWQWGKDSLRILDPAIGDGELVIALLNQLYLRGEILSIEVVGFEIDQKSIERTMKRLVDNFPSVSVSLINKDFIEYSMNNQEAIGIFDFIIANPPYIRTQILGAEKAQELALDFNINGRLDLYYAFLLLAARLANEQGVTGFITSNKFMSIRSGESVRSYLTENVRMLSITDFGDTKLFNAAVLPCTLVFTKGFTEEKSVKYISIYEVQDTSPNWSGKTVFDCIEKEGIIKIEDGRCFEIKRGVLASCKNGAPWVLTSKDISAWKNKVARKTWRLFSDIGRIKVGVKTTADKVFIKADWSSEKYQPELLYPLITHRNAGQIISRNDDFWGILYPHTSMNGKHIAVDISQYPNTQKYLESHREHLESRKYVIEAGRNWYEIWVPQNPAAWENRKIVFRDIADKPQFWIDNSGAIVNGDCYWIDIFSTTSDEEVFLALAIANSYFIEEYYDTFFNTKLFAGKRRFMTQYVKQFPIPYLENPLSIRAIELVKSIIDKQTKGQEIATIKSELDQVVEAIFS